MTKMVSAREFNQWPSRISRDAADQPVIITDRGKPSRVLMSFAEFERLGHARSNMSMGEVIASWPATPDCPEFDEIMEEITGRKDVFKPFEFE